MGLGGVNGGVGGIDVGPPRSYFDGLSTSGHPTPREWGDRMDSGSGSGWRRGLGAGMIGLVLKGFNGGERWASALDSSRSLGMTG